MKKIVFSILGIAMLVVTSCINEKSLASEVKLVTPEEMESILELEDVQLVDVRTPDEYAQDHIESAQNIDFSSPTFDDDIAKLDKSKPVVLYCKAGGRSAKCVKKMEQAGFQKIYDLKGGISTWKHYNSSKQEKKS
ncbi:rhodanese-like domain-containing protein [Winogradskyella maritima]|uniref:Rhodanese-like domain-containing protein n=1 Tax=Winogradskyella maritima TaxID=1517766 RepID=A0ABV8AK66_9FLAO|nr:rhodanese-like domain-containing protein [Winogradskyella maritima]